LKNMDKQMPPDIGNHSWRLLSKTSLMLYRYTIPSIGILTGEKSYVLNKISQMAVLATILSMHFTM
jgi:hypothetical protein